MSGAARSAHYEIRVEGILDQRWATWFEGLQIDSHHSQTVISGPVTDQAALHGLLNKVRDLGLVLISVRRLDSRLTQMGPARRTMHPDMPQQLATDHIHELTTQAGDARRAHEARLARRRRPSAHLRPSTRLYAQQREPRPEPRTLGVKSGGGSAAMNVLTCSRGCSAPQ